MKYKFYCEECHHRFEGKGKKEEFMDPVYGRCWKIVSNCPKCKMQVGEFKELMKSRGSDVSGEAAPAPACATGACPFVS